MVKSVVGEESQMQSAEDRLSRSSILAEVGIVVGKINSHLERGFVYDLIRTPPTESGGPACSLKSQSGGREDRKKGSRGGKSSGEVATNALILIDVEWVAEHARQVSRMLLGGMSVVGIYVWSSEASFKATSTSVFVQAIRGVAQATPISDSETNERLLIHISYSPKRWACRNCAIASTDLWPCDFKMGKLLASLHTYRCMYGFDIRIPVFHDELSMPNTIKNVLHSGISRHAKELRSARALLNENLVTEEKQVTSEGLHNVELLLPFKSNTQHERSDAIAGLVVVKGAICASAYLSPKEPVSRAISDLKDDIINSLKSRLDIVLDEAEDTMNLSSNDPGEKRGEIISGKLIHQLVLNDLRKPLVLCFPRRVLVPWLSGIFLCDYLLPSETFEDLRGRCREIISMEAPTEPSAFLELETEAEPAAMTTSLSSSFWDAAFGFPISKPKEDLRGGGKIKPGRSKSFNLSRLFALLTLLLAVLVGLAIMAFGPAKVAGF